MYDIDKNLNPQMPPIEQIRKRDDSNHGIEPTWTKLAINMYHGSSLCNLPRFMWVQKSTTLKELHLQIFDYFKRVLYEWSKSE